MHSNNNYYLSFKIKYEINNLYYIILYMRWSIEDFVYGGTDGAVTTFAIVSGAFGGLFIYTNYIDPWFC